MKQKTSIILLFAVLILTMVWACTPTSIARNDQVQDGGKHNVPPTETVPAIGKETAEVVADTVKKVITAAADSIAAHPDTLKALADSVVKTAESMTDTTVADMVKREMERLNMPDTTKMDSLALAIYKHNKAVDDSLRLDSLNRQRKNGIDSPVEFKAQDSLI